MPISLKFNREKLLEKNITHLSLEMYEPLAQIDGNLNYKIVEPNNEKMINSIIKSCPPHQKENLFEYLLFSHIKSYYPHLVIDAFNQLDSSYIDENSTIFILSHIRENKNFQLLEHFYPFFPSQEKPLIAEKLNHLVLSQIFHSYEKNEIQPLLDFIKKENIEYDKDVAENYIFFNKSSGGMFIKRFIRDSIDLHYALSHFSNQGFNSYLELFSQQENLIFYIPYNQEEKKLLNEACGQESFNNDYDILVALNKTQTMKLELSLLEKNINPNIKLSKKIKI